MGVQYNQYMKHCKNHRKDRYYQQCSGYYGKSYKEYLKDNEDNNAIIGYGIVEVSTGKLIASFKSWDAVFEYGKKFRMDKDKMLVYIKRSGAYDYSGRTDVIYAIM